MPALLVRAHRIAMDVLFPPECALCGRHGTLLCEGCIAELPRAAGARCPVCWIPVADGRRCRHCRTEPPTFASIRSACVMDEGARRLAHLLKYDGLTSLAAPMAGIMRDAMPPAAHDVIVPVPLHWRRDRLRGYNQAAELARHLGSLTGTRADCGALRRVRDTAPLVKAMGRAERRTIMAGAFAARGDRADGLRVLLVDDVATTGATLQACARALVAGGAAGVNCVTWARAD
jgi:ComF family protein